MTDSWIVQYSNAASAAAWPSANLAIYIPIRVPVRCVARSLWYASGSTSNGNVDMGLYDAAGDAIISATGASKANGGEVQIFDVTDTTVGPGRYYLALVSDSGTSTFYRIAPAAPLCAAWGVLTETSAYPLPATATWAVPQTLAYLPVMGMSYQAVLA